MHPSIILFSMDKYSSMVNHFNGLAHFYRATFNGELEFDFSNVSMKGNIILTYVSLKEQEKVLFNGNLSKASFANTSMTRVRFGDKVVWGKKERNSGNGGKSKEEEPANDNKSKVAKERIDFKIYDERIIEKEVETKNKEPTNSLEAVIAEYRNLRENYEYNLRYEEAGQFFIREMELRRKYKQESSAAGNENEIRTPKVKKKNIFERIFSFAALYYFICDYGESTRKPLAITISIFFIATLYFWYLKGWSMDAETISDSISRTVTSFFPFFSLPENYGFLDVVLRATMIPMAGLLFITLRRKLERRFRH